MLNWSSTFNIAFVSALGALTVFFLASTIAVAAKGKRKCNAFDVALRIAATLVFIASAAMLAAAVLMLLDGSFCIAFLGDKPMFVIGETVTELPIPELFTALSSSIGLMLAALLFICSLAALIVDCLVANKKVKKAKKQPVQKTPEQLKREAELDKIRRIGEDAVKRTGHAAKYAEPSSQKRPAATRPQTPAPSASANASANAAAQASAVQTEMPKAEPTPAPASDWRTQPEPERATEFVGLSNNNDPGFDTFDSFDDISETPEQAADDIIVTERELEPDSGEVAESRAAEQQEPVEFESPEQEDTEQREVDHSFDQASELDERSDEYEQGDFDGEEQPVENTEQTEISDEQPDEYVDEYAEEVEQNDFSAEPENTAEPEQVEDEYADDNVEQPELEPEQEANKERPQEKPIEDEYEPDRDIYIPRIRTIVRNNDNEPAEKPKQQAKSQSKPAPRKKPAAQRKTTLDAKKPASTAKKTAPAAKKNVAAKKPAPKKANGSATAIPPEKKLPITRRYVILDRRNAVNMFGEYLKDRNQAEKDKLKSSINTIIIE